MTPLRRSHPAIVPAVLLVLLAGAPGVVANPPHRARIAAHVPAAARDRNPAAMAAGDLRFPITRERLANGLEILVVEDHTVPVVTLFTFFRTGSRHERTGRTGISHLFEHLMFNGAKKYGPGAFDRALESRGGTSNAFTSEDVTGYYEVFPPAALPTVVDLEVDRLTGLTLTEASLKSEREVVKEERRERVEEDPMGALDELLQATAYLAHPYHWPVVGWPADLDAITVDDCREYFRVHYAPNNAVLVLSGDVEPRAALEALRKGYGAIPSQEPAPAVVADEPEQKGERRAFLRRPAQLPALAIAFHVPGTKDGGATLFALDLVQTILGGGESSRLQQALVRDRPLATSVQAENLDRIDPSLFVVRAEARPGATLDALERGIVAELERLGREPVSDRELQKAKNQARMDLLRQLKTSAGKAELLGSAAVFFGAPEKLFERPQALEQVTAEQVRAAAARFFRADNRTVVQLVPAEPEEKAGP
ncbi:MAG TPA: pitrilysin family protein [Verrucomicrobiae bacterium]|nr:pitrilysin family protein [Verrucomicrobiae bacterium]